MGKNYVNPDLLVERRLFQLTVITSLGQPRHRPEDDTEERMRRATSTSRSTNQAPLRPAIVVLALLAGVALAIGGCGSSGGADSEVSNTEAVKPGGTLKMALGGELENLLPTGVVGGGESNVLSQILDTLFRTNGKGGSEPWLVNAYSKSRDDLTWTLHLHEDLHFSTGQPLTAADVVFSLNTVRKSANWGSLFEGIDKVSAPSKSVVTITTSKPDPALPSQLSLYATGIVPANYGGETKEEFGQHPIASGAFQLSAWKKGESLTLEPNPHYWKPNLPVLNKVIITTIPTDTNRDSQLEGGLLDLIGYPSWAQLSDLAQDSNLRVSTYKSGYTNSLVFNVTTPLFKDPAVRKAANLAIDRASIAKIALGGYGEVAGSWFGPAILYHDSAIEAPPRDIAESKRLLASAVKGGAVPKFKLLYFNENAQENLTAQIIQQNLEEVGFTVTLKPLDSSAAFELIAGGKYDASLIPYFPAIGDPSQTASFYVTYNGFFAGADVSKVAKLVNEAAIELDPSKRRQMYYRIQELIAEEENVIPLNYQPYTYVSRDNVGGFSVNAANVLSLATTGFTS